MYINRTYSEILSELKTLYGTDTDVIEGTFAFDVLSSNAIEFAKTEIEIAEAYRNSFLQTSNAEYLELRAAEAGIYRKEGVKAKGYVNVKGSGTVNVGAIFSTPDNLRFIATEKVEITGSGNVPVEAHITGEKYNVAADTVINIPINIAGIYEVTNPEAMSGGYDTETDEALKARYLTYIRSVPTSNNPAHYIHLARTVSGVGAARCQRCWQGAGTVLVVICDDNFNAANADLIAQVEEVCEKGKIIGAELTVKSAEIVDVEISADITGEIDYDLFRNLINQYFVELITAYEINYIAMEHYEDEPEAGKVSRAVVGSLIIKAGADFYDYDSLKLNGVAADLPLSFIQMPRLRS